MDHGKGGVPCTFQLLVPVDGLGKVGPYSRIGEKDGRGGEEDGVIEVQGENAEQRLSAQA